MKELHEAPLSLFWYWMNERHAIYLRRQRGEAKPWTDDPILRDYKFTNVFRELDRGTVWLRENFLEPHRNDPDNLLVFNVAWYRMFNWWGTGQRLGWMTEQTWHPEFVKQELNGVLEEGDQVFTGAHIIYSTPGLSKVECIVDVCDEIFKQRHHLANLAHVSQSLEQTFEGFKTFDCVGPFMAYEMVTDLSHTRLLSQATDIMTWANPGPGAIRGLKRLQFPCQPREKAIANIAQLLRVARESDQLMPEITKTPLEMRDIEHSLCEFDKYCRVKFREGEPRAKFNGRA